jgi:RHS repeat-associated protein
MYDPLGQPDSKRVGNNLSAPLQTVNYSYNIRGWMTDINNIESLGNDLFAFRISYDKIVHPESGGMPVYSYSPLYNGNIAETYWRTSSDNVLRKYGYDYDKLNRLQSAVYIKPVSGTDPAMPVENYNESLSYDKNGNIMNLIRYGDTDSPPVTAIDDLEYTYDNGNRLKKVKDNTGNPSGFKEGVYTGDAFIYDNYGNLIEDKNKGITSITYNHLNLPKEIIFENDENKKIIYLYNANGQKIKKTIFNSPNVSTVNYQGMFHYENGLLRFFATAEGYVMADTRGYNYVYNYTDHLGNIRLSYTDDSSFGLQVIEENNYYPFGLKHNGYNNISPPNNVYKYKYGGNELQDELNLNVYALGFRDYDPAIGRFNKIDRFSEKYTNYSPYSFAGNNPVIFVDIQGDSIGVGRQYFDRFKDTVENQIANISSKRENRQSKIQRAKDRGKENKVTRLEKRDTKRTQKEDSRLGVLNETLGELNTMESSTNVLYDIYTNVSSKNPTGEGFLGYDTNRNSVTINLVGSYDTGNFAHEFKHGYQFETGRISLFTVNGQVYGGDLYDIQDEVEAYNRGKFFGGIGATTKFIQNNYPSIRNRPEQRTTENTQVTPTVIRSFIISGVSTGLITVPHHYNQN